MTFAAIGLVSAFFRPWQQSAAIGMILALSSTAIVLSTLREKGLMNTSPGQSIFSVLLFQDLAVIPMLALLPLLATAAMHTDTHHGSALFLAPLLFLLHDRMIAPKLQKVAAEREPDVIDTKDRSVILAGFGRLGTDLGRMLISAGIKPDILDHNEANVDVLRRFGFEVYYGDVTRFDLLESAGVAEAELIIITLGDHEKSMELVQLVQKH